MSNVLECLKWMKNFEPELPTPKIEGQPNKKVSSIIIFIGVGIGIPFIFIGVFITSLASDIYNLIYKIFN